MVTNALTAPVTMPVEAPQAHAVATATAATAEEEDQTDPSAASTLTPLEAPMLTSVASTDDLINLLDEILTKLKPSKQKKRVYDDISKRMEVCPTPGPVDPT